MKKAVKKYWAIVLAFLIVISVCLMFSIGKPGMSVDEMYTCSPSGSGLTRFFNDAHPPLYCWLLSLVSVIFGFGDAARAGLLLNLVLFTVSLLMLYRLAVKLFGVREIGAAMVVLFGLSGAGMSALLTVSPGILTMLLSIWLCCLIVSLTEASSAKKYVLSGLCMLLGMMTDPCFVFFGIFVCIASIIRLIVRTRGADLLWFVPSALIGLGLLPVLFPAYLGHTFSGIGADGWLSRLGGCFSIVVSSLSAAVIVFIIAAAAILLLRRRVRLQARLRRIDMRSLVFTIPAILTVIAFSLFFAAGSEAHIVTVAPVLLLIDGFMLHLIDSALFEYGEGNLRTAVLLIITAAAIIGV